MKKLLFGLGAIGAVIAPVAAVVACGDSNNESTTSFALKSRSIDYLFDAPSGVSNANDLIDVEDEVIEAVALEENVPVVKNIFDAMLTRKNQKFAITVDFQDAKVVTDVQVRFNNNKASFIVNKVYIERSSKDVTSTDGRFKVNLFKAFTRKYLASLVEVQKKLSPTATNAEIVAEIKTQYGLATSDVTDPTFFIAPAIKEDIIHVLVVNKPLDETALVNDIVDAFAFSTIKPVASIKFEGLNMSKLSVAVGSTDLSDKVQVKALIDAEIAKTPDFAALFK